MTQQDLSALSDDELRAKAKKLRSASLASAFVIGLMIGIVIWSLIKNNFGLVMLIPMFIAYKLINKGNQDKALKEILKARNIR